MAQAFISGSSTIYDLADFITKHRIRMVKLSETCGIWTINAVHRGVEIVITDDDLSSMLKRFSLGIEVTAASEQ